MTFLSPSLAALGLLALLHSSHSLGLVGVGGTNGPPPLPPADHGDTPLLASLGRPDARLTDLHVFTRGDRLVIAVSTNPAVPPGLTSYLWSSDVTFDVNVDNSGDARVRFDDPFVIELPLSRVVQNDPPLLVWVTAAIDGRTEPRGARAALDVRGE